MEVLKLKIVIILTVKAIFIWAGCVKLMRKANTFLDASRGCNMLQLCECECKASAVRLVSLLEVFEHTQW